LTVRKQLQLEFIKDCILNKDIKNYFVNRDNKYANKKSKLLNASTRPPIYFPAWLSGFIEAEGNFSLVFNDLGNLRKSAFTIGQNDELHVLTMIKNYFKGETKILLDKKKTNNSFDYYRLHLYNALTREEMFNHFETHPLLGHKKVSYKKFFDYHTFKN
jgi:hypothetical protein